MKLQVALDLANKKDALSMCRKIKNHVDIIELGTPLIKQEGLKIIKKFMKFKKPIVADLKTMDTGFFEAEMAFNNGADISSVCGVSDLSTIKGAIKSARKHRKKIIVDLINLRDIKKIKQIIKLNPSYIGVHTGIDMQKKGQTPMNSLNWISKLIDNKKIAVAGGINLKNIDNIVKYNPEIVIVGSAITKSKDPGKIAERLKKKLK